MERLVLLLHLSSGNPKGSALKGSAPPPELLARGEGAGLLLPGAPKPKAWSEGGKASWRGRRRRRGERGEEGQLHQVLFKEGTDEGVVKMVKACFHDGADMAAAVRCCDGPAW